MKLFKAQKITLLLATVVAAALSFSGTVSAIGEGQIAGGNIYTVRNVTKAGAYADVISADKCETVKYSIRLHNPGPGAVNNVNVRVNLPTGASTTNTSTATITSQNSIPATVSDTTTVNISSSQKITFISGSAQLLDANGGVLQGLSDQLVNGSGVNIGEVRVSLEQIKFVQFQAKIDCPTPPTPCVDNPATPQDECNPCVDNPSTPADECKPCEDNKETPMDECNPVTPNNPGGSGGGTSYPTGSEGVGELASTGAGSIAGIVTAAVIAGVIAFRVYLGRRFATNQ